MPLRVNPNELRKAKICLFVTVAKLTYTISSVFIIAHDIAYAERHKYRERQVQLTRGKIDELLLVSEGEHATNDEVLLLIPPLRPLGPLGSIEAEPLAGDLPVAPEELPILLPLLGVGVVE